MGIRSVDVPLRRALHLIKMEPAPESGELSSSQHTNKIQGQSRHNQLKMMQTEGSSGSNRKLRFFWNKTQLILDRMAYFWVLVFDQFLEGKTVASTSGGAPKLEPKKEKRKVR